MPTLSRHWFQFRLRTLLIAVAVLGVPCAWVNHSLNWIRQRHAALKRYADTWVLRPDYIIVSSSSSLDAVRAPCGLWLFGEEGHEYVYYTPGDPPDMANKLGALFPEAKVHMWYEDE